MDIESQFMQRLDGSLAAVASLRDQLRTLSEIANLIIEALRRGGTIYTAGNGGSATHAMHLAEELIGRYRTDRPPLRGICLNADSSALTCIANDFGFDEVFARQCEALVKSGDVLIVFSTSGKSENIVAALRTAKRCGGLTVGLLGKDGGQSLDLCDQALVIHGCGDTAFIQDAHQVALHLLCEAIERMFVGK